MKDFFSNQRTLAQWFICSTAICITVPVVSADELESAFSRRTAVLAFAEQCELLDRVELAALLSGKLQVRGSLLRDGRSVRDVSMREQTAVKSIENLACDNAEALAEIEVVKAGFSSWRTMVEMSYEGTERNWLARRDLASRKPRWQVVQSLRESEDTSLRFGTVHFEGTTSLTLVSEGGLPPKSVLLKLRDPYKLETPPSGFLRRLLKLPDSGIEGMAPPESATRTFFANQRSRADATLMRDEKTKIRGTRFDFGENAFKAIIELDPREAIIVDMSWSNGIGKPDRQQRVYAEVGDFLAAQLFAETSG